MQGLAHHECGLRERVGRAVSEHKLRRPELRHRVAHMVEDRRELFETRYAQRWGTARFGHGRLPSAAWLLSRWAPLGPAVGRGIVGRFGVDPGGATRPLYFLPERRAGLEVIHQEFGGRESVAAMGGGRDHKDDVV